MAFQVSPHRFADRAATRECFAIFTAGGAQFEAACGDLTELRAAILKLMGRAP